MSTDTMQQDFKSQEWYCQKCAGDIVAPEITGLLCAECWLLKQEAA